MEDQTMMKVKVQKLSPSAVIPQYANFGDAGLDLVATSVVVKGDNLVVGTSLAIEIPLGYVGLLFPRSSISKTALYMRNAVGVIDSGYRGEIMFKFGYSEESDLSYKVGDRVGQLIILPYPQIELVESDTLSESDRGTGGFGSTGA